MMKRLSALALLVVTTACCTHQHSSPASAAATPARVVINHANWSMTFPDGWIIDQDNAEATRAHAPGPSTRSPTGVIVTARGMDEEETPEQFAGNVAMQAPRLVQGTPSFIKRNMIDVGGSPASMTIIVTDAKLGFGIVGIGQASTHLGYVIACKADSERSGAGVVCGDVLRSFRLK